MTKPLVAVLSRTPRFSSELAATLHDCCELLEVDTIDEAFQMPLSRPPAAFVADFSQSSAAGHEESMLLDELHTRHPEMQLVVFLGHGSAQLLTIRCDRDEVTTIRSSSGISELRQYLHALRPRTETESTTAPKTFADKDSTIQHNKHPETVLSGITRQFETSTPELKQMLERLEVAARHNVTILLIGETGSEKTYLSRLIHEVSPRCDEPFLHVACGALPAELVESELFGHVKGAFTSAHADKAGKFLAAGAGTVLLDEIDVLGPEQQVKLLRVIETGEFEPMGSNHTLKSRARLVAASNLELQPLVEQGRFRPDLYYHLNTLKFNIPSLRSRRPDISPLARKFVQQSAKRHEMAITNIDPDFFQALHSYPWPGNVRELENAIQSAVIYCDSGVLSAQNLPPNIVKRAAGPSSDPNISGIRQSTDTSLESRMELTEREIIEQVLLNNNFSRTRTARDLGISRVTLYNKMKKYGMMA